MAVFGWLATVPNANLPNGGLLSLPGPIIQPGQAIVRLQWGLEAYVSIFGSQVAAPPQGDTQFIGVYLTDDTGNPPTGDFTTSAGDFRWLGVDTVPSRARARSEAAAINAYDITYQSPQPREVLLDERVVGQARQLWLIGRQLPNLAPTGWVVRAFVRCLVRFP